MKSLHYNSMSMQVALIIIHIKHIFFLRTSGIVVKVVLLTA